MTPAERQAIKDRVREIHLEPGTIVIIESPTVADLPAHRDVAEHLAKEIHTMSEIHGVTFVVTVPGQNFSSLSPKEAEDLYQHLHRQRFPLVEISDGR